MTTRKVLVTMLASATMQMAVLGPGVPLAADACQPDKCIRVGSYNIEHFANTGQADTEDEIKALANRITDTANIDVLVLQEINKEGKNWTGPDGLRTLLRGRGYQEFEGSFGGAEKNRPQFVILLFRTSKVTLVPGSAEEIPNLKEFDAGPTCRYDSLRPPLTAVLKSGNLTFRIIGVHLKSKSKVQGDTSPKEVCDDRIRGFQAEKILAFIDKHKAANIPTVVVGDLNATLDSSEYEVFAKAGYDTLIKTGCSTSKPEQCSYHGFGGPEVIDHVVVHSSMKEAVRDSGTVVSVGNLKDYTDTQSDHIPVWASFRTDM